MISDHHFQMGGNSTIDTKPTGLHLAEARPRVRTAPAPQPTPEQAMPFTFPGGFGFLPPYLFPTMPSPYMQGQGFGCSGSSYGLAASGPSASIPTPAANPTYATAEFPDVIAWFQFLDTHPSRNQDDIHFSPYGEILRNKGFRRITQLTSDFISLGDLQEWLEINVGTAILIMQYAKEDLDAIKSGKWAFPKAHEN